MRDRRRRHPTGPDGIVPGAHSIERNGGRRGVLLLHGFGDTPQSIESVALALHARGFTVHAPLLPGHGRTLEAFSRSDARAWRDGARAAYTDLAAACDETAIVGVSMGGALACALAADATLPGGRPVALVLVTPYLHISSSARLLTASWRAWSLVRPWVSADPVRSIRDPVARGRSLGYGTATPRLLRELRTIVEAGIAASARLTVPTLAIFSRGDYRIPSSAAEASFARLGSPDREIRWVERSGHVVTVDLDGAVVTGWIVEWLDRRMGQTGRSDMGPGDSPHSC